MALLHSLQRTQVYPVEEPEPLGFAPGIRLRPYQRQSLAFMLAVEASTDHRLQGVRHGVGLRPAQGSVRGGWLADEMGMGKTAVCAALVLAAKARRLSDGHKTNELTVVLVNNTLIGQWMDELQRFAPTLCVARFYGSKQVVGPRTDVVVTTPNTRPNERMAAARRLVVDESHLYEPKSDPKLPSTKMYTEYTSPRFVWCVTGTPMSNSLVQLEHQARMIGHWDAGLRLRDLVLAPAARHHPPNRGLGDPHNSRTNEQIVDALQELMIRHTVTAISARMVASRGRPRLLPCPISSHHSPVARASLSTRPMDTSCSCPASRLPTTARVPYHALPRTRLRRSRSVSQASSPSLCPTRTSRPSG